MSLIDSSSDDDCYINSAKVLEVIKKKLVTEDVKDSSLDEGVQIISEDSLVPYMVEEYVIKETPAPQSPKTKRTTRRGRRTRRNVNYYDSDDTENMPELFAKTKPTASISLIDSDPDDMITQINDKPNTTSDDADENYEMIVKIKWQSAAFERVPLRRYQEFSKVFEYFSALENIPQEKISLVYRNQIMIRPSDTPDSLGLTVVDIIEGGIIDGNHSEHQTVDTNVDKDSINIKIQTKDQKKALTISIKKTQKIKVLVMKCAEQLQIPEEKIKFQFDGELVDPNETSESLDLEGGECFDMYTIP